MVNVIGLKNMDADRARPPLDVAFTRLTGTTWVLRTQQAVPVPLAELFPFFANAENLARLTPPELGFDILTPTPIALRVGAVIDYRIRLWGVPLEWRTLISTWRPPVEFIDEQVKGPYAQWIHRHRFTPTSDGGTLVEDEVQFRLPFGRLGAIAAPLVRHQLRRIFAYRRRVIAACHPER
jgi:ligand-binding SRPBCC domain-containing protein